MKLFNTQSGIEEEFSPAGDTVKMYVCGITPYAPAHMGHAMSYVIFDTLRRYLEYKGYKVEHVQNFTDIDDKIIQKSEQEGIDFESLVETHIQDFMDSMEALNIQKAHVYPRATREIPRMIDIIDSLIDKGYAYAAAGDVYFRVAKAEGYGSLSHRSLDGMLSGARVEPGEGKENPMDFALWKGAKPGEPSWESPWGPGRPGWHIECTAMSIEYLGETLDIHGGGQDLIFPHHENEAAQSESYTGVRPFARFWVHNGLLQMGDDKMSKSLGNLVSLEDGLKVHSPDAIRITFLSSSYRRPVNYTEDTVTSNERAAERLRAALAPGGETTGGDILDAAPLKDRFIEAMEADLNTPQALAVLFDMAREINRTKESGSNVSEAQGCLRELGGTLGLTFRKADSAGENDIAPFVDLLLQVRTELRAEKQYGMADSIRDRLTELGVVLEDTAQGTRWKYG